LSAFNIFTAWVLLSVDEEKKGGELANNTNNVSGK
jgi:hypothetical protein